MMNRATRQKPYDKKKNGRQKRRTILTIIIGTIISIVFVITMFSFLLSLRDSDEGVTSIFGFTLVTTGSTSMYPAIKPGDYFYAWQVDADKIEEGDIIVFTSTAAASYGLPVTHRVDAIIESGNGGREFVTKGDNNSAVDEATVTEDRLIARVTRKAAVITFVVAAAENPYIFFPVVYGSAALMLTFCIYELVLSIKIVRRADELPESGEKSGDERETEQSDGGEEEANGRDTD